MLSAELFFDICWLFEQKNPINRQNQIDGILCFMRLAGVEPARYLYHRILNPARLPIPPQPHVCAKTISTDYIIRYTDDMQVA